jgi:hypothetical protein
MDTHKEARAVAYVAQASGAAGVSLGTVGTRQGDIDKLIRPLQSTSTQLGFVDEAGPAAPGSIVTCRSKDTLAGASPPL